MLVNESNIVNPIIGCNVLQELIGKHNSGPETDEIASILVSSLPQKTAGNVNAIIDCIRK